MSQSPNESTNIDAEHPYAEATTQLNKLVRLGRSFSGHELNCCYLNSRDGKFANASAVSGLDYADDGRCVVRCDWDFDGDLDLWVSNRTAPRVRFLRNEFAADNASNKSNQFIALKLIGIASNRDAIGARVMLKLAGDAGATLTQSVRRGEGFLGQSSSWLHFGLGDAPAISELNVRWPNGVVEQFRSAEAGHYFELVEGSGEPKAWTPPEMALKKGSQAAVSKSISPQQPSARHLLSESAPLPPLRYSTFQGESADASQPNRTTDKATLLNLWASWCQPCLKELSEWSRNADRLEELGVEVVAMSVDGLDQPNAQDDAAPRALIERIGFPHRAGMASAQLVELLQLVNNMVYGQDHRPLPVPTSLLIDGRGRLAAVYKGPVSMDRLADDLQAIQENGDQRMRLALPFPGRWLAAQGPHRAGKLAIAMWESGLGKVAVELAERMADDRYRPERAIALWANATKLRDSESTLSQAEDQLERLLQLEPDNAEALMEMGVFTARRGDLPKAVQFFTKASEKFQPASAAAHFNLGKALRALNKLPEAKRELQTSLELNASQPAAHELLGLLLVAEKDFTAAASHFADAWKLERSNKNHLTNLVAALVQTGEYERALRELEQAVEKDPKAPALRASLAQLLLQTGRADEAIAQYEKVVELEPKASQIWYNLSQLALRRGEWAKSIDYLRQVHNLLPEDPRFAAELAWLLATVPEPSQRDGEEAIRLASEASKATERGNWRVLDVLAAAYAEAGHYDQAARTARQAINRIDASQSKIWQQLQQRLDLYNDGKSYRLSPVDSPE